MSEINDTIVPSKFRFFEPVKPTDKPFSYKIAILNTITFCLIAVVDTFKSSLPNVSLPETPEYSWGYWVLLFVFLLLPGTYLLSRLNRCILQILLPYLLTVGLGFFVSLIVFAPPLPNLYQMMAFATFPIPGLMASIIRYYIPHAQIETNLAEVDLQARVRWIEENSNMWRTLAITSIVPSFVFITLWFNYMVNTSQIYVAEVRGSVQALIAIEATVILTYLFIGPIYECFRKAEHIRNMLLAIKKEKV